MVDPIRELVHDHRDLSELLVAVRSALGRVARGQSKLEDEVHEISDGIEALREELLDHFAREQEGLFPFVVKRLPGVTARVDAVLGEHDRIGAMLTHLVRTWTLVAEENDATKLDGWREALGRFEVLYVEHTKSELAFLEEVTRTLSDDNAATEQLRVLLTG